MKKIKTDYLIIGAGQAGLLTGYYLKNHKKKVILVDSNSKIGDSWARRYDCLRLLTPWKDNFLPGLTLKVDGESFPTKDEFAKYLNLYAKKYELNIYQNTKITELKKKGDRFIAKSKDILFYTKVVVVSTGAFQKPYIPSLGIIRRNLSFFHSDEYKNIKQIKEKKVLVVGGGYSGVQIAADLAIKKDVTISLSKQIFFSNRFDFLYVLTHAIIPEGGIRWLLNTLKIRKIQSQNLEDLFTTKKIKQVLRLEKIQGNKFYFADGSVDTFQAVIFATGYFFDYSWIKIPNLFDTMGRIRNKNPITSIDGLYVVYPTIDYGFVRDLPSRVERIIKHVKKNF